MNMSGSIKIEDSEVTVSENNKLKRVIFVLF